MVQSVSYPSAGVSHATVALPSQIHPTYPYGNPRLPSHPANRPRTRHDPSPRALFEDAQAALLRGTAGPGPRWSELALGSLLPVDGAKAEQARAAQARKMASGAGGQPPSQATAAPGPPAGPVPPMGQGPPQHPGVPPAPPVPVVMDLPLTDDGDDEDQDDEDDEGDEGEAGDDPTTEEDEPEGDE
jgi:hypothetical protein